MDNEYFRKITTTIILAVLIVLAFFLLRPILLSIIVGLILAIIFLPVYNKLNKIFKSGNLSAFLICLLLIILIVIPIWYLAPVMINQSIKIYVSSQQMDFVTPLENIFPSLFESEIFALQVGNAVQSFVTKSTNSMMISLSNFILDLPVLFLQFLVVLFTFFFALKDNELFVNYIKSLMPFSKEVENKLFKSSKNLTLSILYGQVVIGIVQGLVAGIGFFIFKIPNALLLTALAAVAGIFPIIGTAIVWVPVAIYLLMGGNTFAAFGIIVFGLVSSIIENAWKPIFVAKRTQLNSSVILIGMIGGLFMFGILGIILGPLILAYLLIILEIYRNKRVKGFLIENKDIK